MTVSARNNAILIRRGKFGKMGVYGNAKMLALLGLGIASGLPLFLVQKNLQAWLTKAGVDVGIIGAFSLVSLPYSLKFLWSPIFDRYRLPFWGRRRGWLASMQGCLLVAILILSLLEPQGFTLQPTTCQPGAWVCHFLAKLATVYQSPFFWVATLIAFYGASQDIVVDAYRTEILPPSQMGAGAAIFVLGYRFALVITGGLAFALAETTSWQIIYRWLGLLMVLAILVTWVSPQEEEASVGTSLSQSFIAPIKEFCNRSYCWLILLFIPLYRIGDGLVNNMAVPFLLRNLRLEEGQLGIMQTVGLLATIVGTLVGGTGVHQLGINRSLWVFGLLQTMSNFSYALLAGVGNNWGLIFATINIENFCGGLATAAFTAYLMSLCHRQFTATQYALLSSLFAVSRDILVSPAGEIAKTIGWVNFFLGSVVVSLPGLVLLWWVAPWRQQE